MSPRETMIEVTPGLSTPRGVAVTSVNYTLYWDQSLDAKVVYTIQGTYHIGVMKLGDVANKDKVEWKAKAD